MKFVNVKDFLPTFQERLEAKYGAKASVQTPPKEKEVRKPGK